MTFDNNEIKSLLFDPIKNDKNKEQSHPPQWDDQGDKQSRKG